MKLFIYILLLIINACGQNSELEDNSQINKKYALNGDIETPVDFVIRGSLNKFGSYLIRDVSYEPIQDLKRQIETDKNIILKDNGEANITVVAPGEFKQIRDFFSSDIIKKIRAAKVKDIRFKPLCLGLAEAEIDGKKEQVYFIVVDSLEIFDLRNAIFDNYKNTRESALPFDPDMYYPHITVGFTKRDLHIEDGVKKDRNSCIADIIIK